MRNRQIYFLLTLAMFLYALPAFSADFTIDLATEKSVTRTVNPGGAIHLTVFNRVAAPPYVISTTRKSVEIKALKIPDSPPAAPSGDLCKDAPGAFFDAYVGKTKESDVAQLVAKTRINTAGCSEEVRKFLEQTIKANTTFDIDEEPLLSGQELTVTISRAQDKETLTWTFVASTGSPGDFKILYGFNFIPAHDDHYFLAPTDDAKKFKITKATRRERFDFAPSMFFTFQTEAGKRRPVDFAPVAGLGFDMSNPVVFGGVTAIFRQNISLNVGIVVHQEKRLNGKYDAKDASRNIVAENLTDDQLYQKTYAPQFFVGVGFHFENNPFAKKNDEKK